MTIQNKRFIAIVASVMILLLIPLIAMQFSSDVNWKLNDFLVAGLLLLGTGLIIELVLRKVKKRENRIFLSIAVVTILVLIWIELAVGIFGSPFAGS